MIVDVGGKEVIRPLWRHYITGKCTLLDGFPIADSPLRSHLISHLTFIDDTGIDAVFFVVDSSDRARFAEIWLELFRVLSRLTSPCHTLLVFANKQDIKGCKCQVESRLCLLLN